MEQLRRGVRVRVRALVSSARLLGCTEGVAVAVSRCVGADRESVGWELWRVHFEDENATISGGLKLNRRWIHAGDIVPGATRISPEELEAFNALTPEDPGEAAGSPR